MWDWEEVSRLVTIWPSSHLWRKWLRRDCQGYYGRHGRFIWSERRLRLKLRRRERQRQPKARRKVPRDNLLLIKQVCLLLLTDQPQLQRVIKILSLTRRLWRRISQVLLQELKASIQPIRVSRRQRQICKITVKRRRVSWIRHRNWERKTTMK